MVNRYFAFLILTVIFGCKSSSKHHVWDTYSDGKVAVELITADDDTSSGKLLIYYHDGTVYKELTMLYGKYVGVKKTFFKNGMVDQLDSLYEPCDTFIDACNGIVVRYYENGKLAQRYTVKNNEHNGPCWQYREDGTLAKNYELLHDSIKNGYYLEYYRNGNVATKMMYRNDTIVGISYNFLENGDTVQYCNHFKGHENFPYKYWVAKDKAIRGDYVDSAEKNVIWTWYLNSKEVKRKVVPVTRKGVPRPSW